jgi:hypothetical protein
MSEFCKGCAVPTAYIVLAFVRKNKIMDLNRGFDAAKIQAFYGILREYFFFSMRFSERFAGRWLGWIQG